MSVIIVIVVMSVILIMVMMSVILVMVIMSVILVMVVMPVILIMSVIPVMVVMAIHALNSPCTSKVVRTWKLIQVFIGNDRLLIENYGESCLTFFVELRPQQVKNRGFPYCLLPCAHAWTHMHSSTQ